MKPEQFRKEALIYVNNPYWLILSGVVVVVVVVGGIICGHDDYTFFKSYPGGDLFFRSPPFLLFFRLWRTRRAAARLLGKAEANEDRAVELFIRAWPAQ